MDFSTRLRELRQNKGVSQSQLASDIHISRSAVAKWENGLGLPNDESLHMLAEYFDVSKEYLISNIADEEVQIKKHQTINKQNTIFISFAFGCLIGLFILAFVFIKPLRGSLQNLGLGAIITSLGIYNIRGNIGSIHWYNRRKVSKEAQLPYCRLVGLGTIVIGVGLISGGVIQALISAAAAATIIICSVTVGLTLVLIAQFRYNHGLF